MPLQMMLDRLREPGVWDDSASFRLDRPREGLDLDFHAVRPLHWAAIYGHSSTFALLLSWFRDYSLRRLLDIVNCSCDMSLLDWAVLHLFHPQPWATNTIKIIRAVVSLFPPNISFSTISPLFLAMDSDFVKAEAIEAFLDVPGGVVAYDDWWDSCVAGILRPVPPRVLLDAGVEVNMGLLTNMGLRVVRIMGVQR